MIPDIAVIISAYAVARLLNEYVFLGEQLNTLRVVISLIAAGIIGMFLLSVISASGSLSSL